MEMESNLSMNAIPSEAAAQFQEIVRHEMFDMDRSLARSFDTTVAKMTPRGLGLSGNLMSALTEEATNSLKARGHFILGQLLRCLAAHGVELTDEVVVDAIKLLKNEVDDQFQFVGRRLWMNGVFNASGLVQAKQALETQYGQEGPRLVARLSIELKLSAATTKTSQRQGGAPSFNFSGPVALVQAGNGNFANVHQHIDASTKSEVARALQFVLEELDKPENASIGNKLELRELVVDAKAEVEKPNANPLKLGSMLRAAAEGTKFVGSLGPAYQVLKPVLSFFGIQLP